MKKVIILMLMAFVGFGAMAQQRNYRQLNVSDSTKIKVVNEIKQNDTIAQIELEVYDMSPRLVERIPVTRQSAEEHLVILNDELDELIAAKEAIWDMRDKKGKKQQKKKDAFINDDIQIQAKRNEIKTWNKIVKKFK